MAKNHFPTSTEEIVQLCPPSESWLAKANGKNTYKATRFFLDKWKEAAFAHPTDEERIQYKCPECKRQHEYHGLRLWTRKFMILASYYDFGLRRYLGFDGKDSSELAPGLNLHEYIDLTNRAESDQRPRECSDGMLIMLHYLQAIQGIYFTDMFRAIGLPNLPTGIFESMGHSRLLDLHKLQMSSESRSIRYCAERMVHGLLELMSSGYEKRQDWWNREHVPGWFSGIRLHDLSLIAARDKRVQATYGAGNLDKVLEQQLALIFQTFGFRVVSTRRGERTVDMVCLGDEFSILVEAKSSTHPYSLPVSDQRALEEYAREVQRTLKLLPPLKLILIIGPEHASSLEQRLSSLENTISVPVRFAKAQDVANLRESIPGPLHMRTFIDSVRMSETRVLKPLGKAMREEHDYRNNALAQLVKAELGVPATPKQLNKKWQPEEHKDC